MKLFQLFSFSETDTRRVMRLFFAYRVVLALALMIFDATHRGPSFLGASAPVIHHSLVWFYFFASLFSWLFSFGSRRSTEWEYLFALFVDSICIAGFIYTSGGPQSGLGILLGIAIAFGTQGMPARATVLAALMATLAILMESWYAFESGMREKTTYSMVAMLSLSYFAIALLSYQLSHRTRLSEKILAQQKQDILNLTQLNELVIQQMQTGVLVLDCDQKIKMYNQAAVQLLNQFDLNGRSLTEIHPKLQQLVKAWQEEPHNHLIHWHYQEAEKQLLLRINRLSADKRAGILIFIDDAAAATQAAQQLKLASLGRLVASIAHEIRNPLSAIAHAAQLLQESDLQQADKHLVDIIERNANRLNQIVHNIIALSKPHLHRQEQMILLKDWLPALIAEIIDQSPVHSGQIIHHIEPEDLQVKADAHQLQQIISAIIDNAIKHQILTEKGNRIIVHAHQQDQQTCIDICDNGELIDPHIIDRLYEPFFTTSHQGTGLGLYIVKALCDSHQIQISYLNLDRHNCFRLRFKE